VRRSVNRERGLSGRPELGHGSELVKSGELSVASPDIVVAEAVDMARAFDFDARDLILKRSDMFT
jgi:hypothetical protein